MTDLPPTLPPEQMEPIVARHAAAPTPIYRDRAVWVGLGFVLAVVGLVAWWVGSISSTANHNANDPCRPGDKRAGCVAAAQAQGVANQANGRLKENGLPPVPTPSSQVPVPTVTVTASPVPPSQAAIEDAVAAYCEQTKCGSGPTAAQVAQAVASFCSIDGRCRGPAGPTGKNGTGEPGQAGASGATGAAGASGAAGTDGQNATSDQVAVAVADYCTAHGECAGQQGSQGPSGENGGQGAAGQDGQPPVSWTYTDSLGMQHTCVRSTDFQPSAPTYTCH